MSSRRKAAQTAPVADTTGACLARLRAKLRDGSPAAKRIARFVLDSPARARHMSVDALAGSCGTNPSTITRFSRGLGYRGYREFQLDLAVAVAQDAPSQLDELFKGATPAAIIRGVFECNRRSLSETEKLLDAKVIRRVATLIRRAKRTVFLGVGASGQAARQAAERFTSLGLVALAATDPYDQIFATTNVRRGHVALGISHTGQTTHVLEALRVARRKGARTICITNYPDSPIATEAEFRLITAFREHRVNAAVSSSHVAQLCIIDTLYFAVASSLERSARKLADEAEGRVRKMLRTESISRNRRKERSR